MEWTHRGIISFLLTIIIFLCIMLSRKGLEKLKGVSLGHGLNATLYWEAFNKSVVDPYTFVTSGAPLQVRFSTCAYIANSGHLLKSNRGEDIDSHDCVIRANDAPTTGFEKDVGTKTTIRTVDHSSLDAILGRLKDDNRTIPSFDDNIFNNSIVLVYRDPKNRYKSSMNKTGSEYPNIILAQYSSEQNQKIRDMFAGRVSIFNTNIWVSNAFYSLVFARDVCTTIDVYGITDEEYCNRLSKGDKSAQNVDYHYYGPYFGKECYQFEVHAKRKDWAHRFLREKKLFRQWKKEWGNLQFHQPEWPNLE